MRLKSSPIKFTGIGRKKAQESQEEHLSVRHLKESIRSMGKYLEGYILPGSLHEGREVHEGAGDEIGGLPRATQGQEGGRRFTDCAALLFGGEILLEAAREVSEVLSKA